MPNLSQGYARSEAESAYPNLWKGLRGLWLPGIRTGGMGTNAVRDFSGRGNHGTMNGSMTTDDWVISKIRPGLSGYALDFDGIGTASGDYVHVTDNVHIAPMYITVSMWVKFDSVNNVNFPVPLERLPVNQNYLFVLNADDKPIWRIVVGTVLKDATATAVVPTNTWELWTGTYDGTTSRLYRNANLAASLGVTGAIDDVAGNLVFGGQPGGGNASDCKIADVRIYDRALKPYEIRQIYRGASPLALAPSVVGLAPVVTGGPWPHHMDNQGLVGGFSSLGI